MKEKAVIGIVILIALLFSSTSIGFWSTNAGDSAKNNTTMRDLNSGLVAYWNFDEGSGNVLHDVSGNGNDGTIYGATWVEGVKGDALSFDGEDNYIKIPNSPSLNPRNATFEAFVYIDSYPQYGNASGIIFKYESYQVNLGCEHTNDDKTVWFGIWGDYLTGGELTLHRWYQIIVTFSQTGIYEGTAKLYINGKLIVSEILMDRIDSTTNPLIIGYKNDTGGGHFNGTIDEVRIYNRALTPQEINDLYCQYVPKAPGNLQANMGREWIELHWNTPDNANNVGLTGYEIYRSEDGVNYEKIGETANTSYNDTSVVEGRTYHYYVVGENANGIEGDKSENFTVNFVFSPTSPQNLNAEYMDRKVVLSWDKPTDDGGVGIDGYTIYRSEDGVNYKKIGVTADGTNEYYDEKVDNGKTYYYYVTATNRVGVSEKSNRAKISIPNPFPWLWIILGLIIAAIVIGVVLLMARKKKRIPASAIPPQQPAQQPHQTQQPPYQQASYPPSSPPPSSAQLNTDIEERLRKLSELKEKGLISDEEYQKKKEELLSKFIE